MQSCNWVVSIFGSERAVDSRDTMFIPCFELLKWYRSTIGLVGRSGGGDLLSNPSPVIELGIVMEVDLGALAE